MEVIPAKTRDELIEEVEALQQRVKTLEQAQLEYKHIQDELEERVRLTTLSSKISLILAGDTTLSEILQQCANATLIYLEAAFARIWLFNPRENLLELKASAGLYTHLDGAHSRIPLGHLKIGRIAKRREAHLTNSISDDPNISDREWARQQGITSFAGYPLLVGNHLQGVIAIFAYKPLSETVLSELATIANSLALGIDRKLAELYLKQTQTQLKEQWETVETINRVGQIISAELDLQKLVQAVTDSATKLTEAEFGAFFYNLLDEKGGRYTLYTISGVAAAEFAKFPMPRNTDLFGPTFRGEGVIRLANVHKDFRFGKNDPYYGMPKGHLPVSSYLAVPVISRSGEVLGGLFFGHSKPNVFTERTEQLVVGLATQTAIAMDNAQLYTNAQRTIQVRDDFLSIAAHELKTPITSMQGFAQLAIHQYEKGAKADPSRIHKYLLTINQQSHKLAQLVTGLLDLARIESGQLSLERQVTDVSLLIKNLLVTLQSTTAKHSLELEAPEQSLVLVDPLRLEQVLSNLLNNAIKYSPQGGPVKVAVYLTTPDDQHLYIAVSDRGIGIPVEYRDGIFERFYRAHSGHNFGGLGLGLYISRQIIELHGGQISVEFKEGETQSGTRFIIKLPIH